MAALIPPGKVGWGIQLPVQAQSSAFVQPWERDAGPTELASIALAAERAGALYVGVCDHIAIPASQSDVMGTTWYDTVATLGWLAAHTTNIRLLSHVLVLPYRHPLAVAKAFSTLDVLSNGRTILGVGAGHVAEEFEVLGADFEGRGRKVASSVEVIRRTFVDEFVDVAADDGGDRRVGIGPRPVQPGGPPIWIGGSSRAAVHRAAMLGDGWLPQGLPKMGTSAAIAFIAETRKEAGLPVGFDIGANIAPVFVTSSDGAVGTDSLPDHCPEYTIVGPADVIAERLRGLIDRGINQLQPQFQGRDAGQVRDQIERFGAEVAPLL